MSKLSRKETVAMVTVIIVFACTLGWTLLRMGTSNASGLTLRETFAQPPGGPAAGPPLVSSGLPSHLSSDTSSTLPMQTPASAGAGPTSRNGTQDSSTAADPLAGASGLSAPLAASDLVVHVAGAVKKPGVYHLPIGARNDDAIQKAGGATSEANTDAINLAAHLEDGSQLYLPTRKQHPEGGADAVTSGVTSAATATKSTKSAGRADRRTASGAGSAGKSGAKSGKSGKLSDPSQGTVNLNTASMEELQRIPGIGPSMAERIIAFRKEGGKFQAAEDLLQISGIGEKKYARMQPYVRVK